MSSSLGHTSAVTHPFFPKSTPPSPKKRNLSKGESSLASLMLSVKKCKPVLPSTSRFMDSENNIRGFKSWHCYLLLVWSYLLNKHKNRIYPQVVKLVNICKSLSKCLIFVSCYWFFSTQALIFCSSYFSQIDLFQCKFDNFTQMFFQIKQEASIPLNIKGGNHNMAYKALPFCLLNFQYLSLRYHILRISPDIPV